MAAGRQVEVDHFGVEVVGYLDQDAGAVPAVLLAAGGPAMGQVLEGGDGLADQGVGGPALQVGHQGHAAGVVLEPGIVEPAVRRRRGAGAHTGHRQRHPDSGRRSVSLG